MGVHGLWKILEPTASPVKLEALRGKTLAIDASIWIYHFLKAMRDPKGTIITAAHIIGFFRRICKLMFFEIKPVFVFDGAAPTLKKLVTSKRSERRIGREQSARATANKLLTLQMQRTLANAKSEEKAPEKEVEVIGKVPEGAVYMDQLQGESSATEAHSTDPTASSSKREPFVKMDQYHLPEIDSITPLSAGDQRLLNQEELEEYSRQFTSQARSGFIDTSLVDFKSKDFQMLPLETQYQLLNMARLKSRLRMGYTAEELNQMFPDELEFSKFQINRVTQRNFFTQRLMNLVGLEEDLTKRVSSEKNKEYLLKKTDQGWSLSLEDRSQSPVVESDQPSTQIPGEGDDDSGEDDFEEIDLSPSNEQGSPQAEALNVEQEATSGAAEIDAEEAKSLDELFGFEAHLTRQQLYNKLMDEVVDEESDGEDETESKEPTGSLLFGNRQPKSQERQGHLPEDDKSPSETAETAVQRQPLPWFEKKDNTFEQMEIVEEKSQPNFVRVDEYYSSSESEDEEVAKETPELAKPSTPVEVSTEEQFVNEAVSDPTRAQTFDLKQAPNPPPLKIDETQAQTLVESVPKTADTESAVVSEKEVPTETEVSTEASDKNITLAADNEEPIIELTEDAAVRAEEEAKEEKEEDEDIAGMLIAEAEENERFARELAKSNHQSWTAEDERDYEVSIRNLRQQFAKQTRDSDSVSTEMIQECQELLQLFGIPYISAPSEAEAQCAKLRQLKLVDGVVTDDGDTFLFDTSAAVYRNMFSQSRFVEFYSTRNIEDKLGLDRKGLIQLAFLLGSDYTEGIVGIGPVTGVEILAEFGDLETFAQWWNKAQRTPDAAGVDTPLKRRLLKQFKSKLFLPEDFPNSKIVDAYLHPSVDTDATKFSWGTPDLEGLRKFMAATAGWSAEKTNSALLPVVQESKRRELQRKTEAAYNQSHLEDFFRTVVQNPDLNSKRAAKATNKLRKRARTEEH